MCKTILWISLRYSPSWLWLISETMISTITEPSFGLIVSYICCPCYYMGMGWGQSSCPELSTQMISQRLGERMRLCRIHSLQGPLHYSKMSHSLYQQRWEVMRAVNGNGKRQRQPGVLRAFSVMSLFHSCFLSGNLGVFAEERLCQSWSALAANLWRVIMCPNNGGFLTF